VRTSPEPKPDACRCSGGCAAAIETLRPAACWQDSPALGELCRGCWSVVYRSVRRQFPASDAEDLTQSFFVRAIERRSLREARLAFGCFRPYLLAAVRHFVANERARQRAGKRGGEAEFLTFEDDRTPCRCSLTGTRPGGPEEQLERARFDQAWEGALARVREEARGDSERRRVEALLPHLEGLGRSASCERLAVDLGMTQAAVRVALHRLRRKIGSSLAAAGFRGLSST